MTAGGLRPEEEFVGRALATHLAPGQALAMRPGEDPPDLYLTIDGEEIAVEVTRLVESTIDPKGTIANRTSEDQFGIYMIERLDKQLGPLIPADRSLFIAIKVPVADPTKFRRALEAEVTAFASQPLMAEPAERTIAGVETRVQVIPARQSGARIVGTVENAHSSADIGFNARRALLDRITVKSALCARIPGKRYLALYNDIWLASPETYLAEARTLEIAHGFDKVFAVFQGGKVVELDLPRPAATPTPTLGSPAP